MYVVLSNRSVTELRHADVSARRERFPIVLSCCGLVVDEVWSAKVPKYSQHEP
jgi:hypothetical protein